jgi:phosphohistidine phosphatase SixA
MQQLMILRHAQAAGWVSGSDDFSRPLTEAGTMHARQVAHYISANLDLPEDILCSPAQRTRETLAPLLFNNPGLENVTRFVPQIYNAPLENLVSLLDFAFAEKDRALIVGHNPGIGQLASELISGPTERLFSAMPAGTLVVIDFDPGWGIGSSKGTLNRRVTQTELSID